MPEAFLEPAAADAGRIPVLDIGPYLAGESCAVKPLAAGIGRTCEDTGFLVVAPVPTCTGPDNPPRCEPTTYGEFTRRLLTLNFAHRRGEEPPPTYTG